MYLDVVGTVVRHPTPEIMHEIKASKRLGRSLNIKNAALMRSEVSPVYNSQCCEFPELLGSLNIDQVDNIHVSFALDVLMT